MNWRVRVRTEVPFDAAEDRRPRILERASESTHDLARRRVLELSVADG